MARLPAAQPAGYLLCGDDEVARKERLQALLAERLEPEAVAFNLDRLSARDADPSVLATVLETPPLLGAMRVVVVEDASEASAAVARVIRGFLESPCPTTCLIAVAEGKPAGEPWTTLRRVGREEVFEPPRGLAEVKARIKREVERAGKRIEDGAASMLAGLNPDGSMTLQRELEKLLAYVGERGRIEAADVEAVAVSGAEGNRYTFVDLVGMGRREEAVAELHALLEAGESPIYLLTLLAQHFLLLGAIRACEARGIRSPEAVARAVGKPAWLLTRRNFRISGHEPIREQARRYDREAIDRWLACLLELDLMLKSSRLDPAALMEASVLRLMTVDAAAAHGSVRAAEA